VLRSVVLGYGSYLPERVLTNAELAQMVDTSDEWIVQRTGIRQRHIAAEGEFTSHLGLKAAQAAIAKAGVDAQSIDLIVLATSTPDHTFPATAVAGNVWSGVEVARMIRSIDWASIPALAIAACAAFSPR
jgi:3-oxoacyl-[acyl-carrier-protein] synthase-3